MRIAIVTVYDSIINFGSFLQAYCLSEVLKEMGHDVFFVRRMSDTQILERFNELAIKQNTVPRNKKLRLLRQIKKNPIKKIELKNNLVRYEQSKMDWEHLAFIDQKDVNSNNIDLIICGSDEIWNVNNVDIDIPFYTCAWTGEDVRKIAYAISAGNTKPQEVDDQFYSAISKFDYLLPRDNMSQQLFDKLLHKKYEIVCDPTILYGKPKFEIKPENEYGKYLLVYSYGLSKKEKAFIKNFSREKNLKIISPCMYLDIADEVIFTSALDFPTLISHAEYVYTTTFHGTIFSLMFAKHFACRTRLPKILDVINSCDAGSAIFELGYDYNKFVSIMEGEVDHTKIESRMKALRDASMKLLLSGIEGSNEGVSDTGSDNEYPKYLMGISKSDNVRMKSSSGGIFYELSKATLDQGGIVFGAIYDSQTQRIRHADTDSVSIEALMRSKYAESDIGDSFSKVLDNLSKDRKVLFAGTPCQVAGLRKLVDVKAKDKSNNLLLVDFLCEGVPSKKIFGEYQKLRERKAGSKVKEVLFRSKAYGWSPYSMKVVFENGKEYVAPYFMDEYLHTFLNDLVFNRPSCYYCHFREEKKSDITLGDFWNVAFVDKQKADNKGVSVIFVNTERGNEEISKIAGNLDFMEITDNKRFYMEQHLDLRGYKASRDEFYKNFEEYGFENSISKFSTYYKNVGLKRRFGYIKHLIKLERRRQR